MSNAEKFLPQYTVEDYQSWQGDWELWEGHAVSMSPSPFADHSKIAAELCRLIGNAIKANPVCRERVNLYTELDWIVSDDTVVRPDLSISCGSVFEKHITTPPAVAIEILSSSTRDHDLGFKHSLYQSQAVPYYLIVDPAAKSFTQFHFKDAGYKDITNGKSASFTVCGDCTFEVALSEIFN